MEETHFTLQPYKGMATRHSCPNCHKTREFVRYIDVRDGEILADWVGRCNREVECGYHYTPKQYFRDNQIYSQPRSPPDLRRYSVKKQIPSDLGCFSTLDRKLVNRTMSHYAANPFSVGLSRLFTNDIAYQIVSKYKIGTTHKGGTIFWQIDEKERVRTGKVLFYDAITLKRQKDIPPTWSHSLMKVTDFRLRQCLYGQHLLATDKRRSVAIVESEKSAIICHAFLPNFIWLATGGSHGSQLNDPDTMMVLKNRRIRLFPDRGAYLKWEKKAEIMRQAGMTVSVSDQLENTNCPPNWDIADSLLLHRTNLTLSTGAVDWALTETDGYPVFWDYPTT